MLPKAGTLRWAQQAAFPQDLNWFSHVWMPWLMSSSRESRTLKVSMAVCKRLQEWIISRQANILKTKEINLGAKGSCKALGVYDFFTSFSVGVGDWTHGLMCVKWGLYHWTTPLHLKNHLFIHLFVYLFIYSMEGCTQGLVHVRKIYEYMDGQMDRQTDRYM